MLAATFSAASVRGFFVFAAIAFAPGFLPAVALELVFFAAGLFSTVVFFVATFAPAFFGAVTRLDDPDDFGADVVPRVAALFGAGFAAFVAFSRIRRARCAAAILALPSALMGRRFGEVDSLASELVSVLLDRAFRPRRGPG